MLRSLQQIQVLNYSKNNLYMDAVLLGYLQKFTQFGKISKLNENPYSVCTLNCLIPLKELCKNTTTKTIKRTENIARAMCTKWKWIQFVVWTVSKTKPKTDLWWYNARCAIWTIFYCCNIYFANNEKRRNASWFRTVFVFMYFVFVGV